MEILTLFLIGLSLSIDAFSLSLAYGLLNVQWSKIIVTSVTVGIFHFFMPLLGSLIGFKLLNTFKINPKYIIALVIILIIVEMIRSLKEKEKPDELKLKVVDILFFSFFVSLDSFSVGIGIYYITPHPLYGSIIFAFTSAIFTFIGFKIGKIASKKIGKISKYIGIIILFSLLLYFLFN